jgi:tetratricopeptide (TPR) repeat protein
MDDSTLEYIERYLDGELSAAELTAFETRLRDDPAFAFAVEQQQEIIHAISDQEVDELEAKLQIIFQENRTKAAPVPLHRRLYFQLAAIGLVLVLSIWVFKTLPGPQKDPEALYAQYFEPYSIPSHFRSGTDSADSQTLALQSYEKGEYAKAAVAFREIISENPDKLWVYLLDGICRMESDQLQESRESFDTIISNGDNLFLEQAKWYLALSFLKENRPADARPLLQELSTGTGKFARLARNLLKEMTTP